MLEDEKLNKLRHRLEKFRQGLSLRKDMVNDSQSLTVSEKISDSVQAFDLILRELNDIVINKLEKIYYWDEIENILVLIVENRVGIDLADRKQYARDIINFGKNEEWLTISDYLISVLNRCGSAENDLFNIINTSSRSTVPELANIVQYTTSAGLNYYQLQEVNMELTKSLIRRDEAIYVAQTKAQIEYLEYKAKHDEDLRFEKEKK